MKPEDITLDWLQARVREDEDGCWIWTGATKKTGMAVARIGNNLRPVRLVLLELMREKPLAKGFESGCTCGKKGCVHPLHIVAKRINQTLVGRKMPVTHKARIAQAKRSVSDIPQDVVRQIRADEQSSKEWAAQLDVDYTYINAIRANKVRKEYSNPFAGLGA